MTGFLKAVGGGEADPTSWPIERVLAEPASDFSAAMDAQRKEAAITTDSIYIYGSGQNGRWLATLFAELGRKPMGFIDDLPSRRGTVVEGLPVLAADALGDATERTLVVVSMFSPGHSFVKTRHRLEKFRCRVMSLPVALNCFFPQALPFYFVDRPENCLAAKPSLLKLSAAMADGGARDRLWRYLVFLLTLDDKYSPLLEPARFERPEVADDVIFVDGGAFNGDTLALFLAARGEKLKRAVLFEPDGPNFKSLAENVAALPEPLRGRIEIHNCGLWSRSDVLSFTASGTTATHISADGADRIEVRALDEICTEPGHYVVKLDVEGAEEQALLGMRALIRRQNPYIEAAVYHNQADLYRLPETILSLGEGYAFDLRSYGHDGTDTMICALPR